MGKDNPSDTERIRFDLDEGADVADGTAQTAEKARTAVLLGGPAQSVPGPDVDDLLARVERGEFPEALRDDDGFRDGRLRVCVDCGGFSSPSDVDAHGVCPTCTQMRIWNCAHSDEPCGKCVACEDHDYDDSVAEDYRAWRSR